jgi:NhaP-type Na+/H+ or K+/H+ antiporter
VTAFLRTWSDRRGWLDERWAQVVPLGAAVLAYVVAADLGGSGFIASFVAGLVFGARTPRPRERRVELLEEVGDVLSGVTFILFAAVMVGPALREVGLRTIVYAVLSLTVIRMVPVAIALARRGAQRAEVLYAGWFGPRGLASIVFALIVVEDADLPGTRTIVEVATMTVALSIVAHGITAPSFTSRLVRRRETVVDVR